MKKLARWLGIAVVGLLTATVAGCGNDAQTSADTSAVFSQQASIRDYRGKIEDFKSPTGRTLKYAILKRKVVSGRTDYAVLLLTPQKELDARDVTELGKALTNESSYAGVTFWLNQQVYEANTHGDISSRSAIKGLSRNLVATFSKNYKEPESKTWKYGVSKISWMQRSGQFSKLRGKETIVSRSLE